jgi:hypothetical protein
MMIFSGDWNGVLLCLLAVDSLGETDLGLSLSQMQHLSGNLLPFIGSTVKY